MKTKHKTNPEPIQNTGIQVGASKEAISQAGKTILEILNSGAEQKTMRAALKSLNAVCAINNTTISDCTIQMGEASK